MNANINKMFNPSALIERMFKKADGVVWDLMTGHLGVEYDGGIATFDPAAGQVQLNLMNFSMPLPAFAQNTPISQVKVGDLVITGKADRHGWVTEVKDKSIRIMRPDGSGSTHTPVKVATLGLDQEGVMVVRSLINMLPGGSTGLAGLQSSLLPLMMMGGGDLDLDSMMPMLLISQMGVPGVAAPTVNPDGTTTPAPVNPFGSGNMMQTMLMMQMMKGFGGNNNPFGSSSKDRKPFNN